MTTGKQTNNHTNKLDACLVMNEQQSDNFFDAILQSYCTAPNYTVTIKITSEL